MSESSPGKSAVAAAKTLKSNLEAILKRNAELEAALAEVQVDLNRMGKAFGATFFIEWYHEAKWDKYTVTYVLTIIDAKIKKALA